MTRSTRTLLLVVVMISLAAGGLLALHSGPLHVQLAPEVVLHIGGFGVTNTMIAAYLATAVLALFFWRATRRAELIPGRVQAAAELIIEVFVGLCANVAGERNGRRFFTLVTSIFLFVLVANWMGLLPFFGTVGRYEPAESASGELVLVPFLRGATTDLNTTMALALTSVIATQVFGIRTLGAGSYLSKFFNFRGGPIGIFIGFIELISEISRIISFSFRLFGNIFAGEVLLAVVGFLLPLVATLPFLGLELFVGVIQAFIFAMLTLVFLTIATISHGEHHEESAEPGREPRAAT